MSFSVINPAPQVPEKVKSIWRQKQTRGDVARLTAYTGLSKPTIIKALKHGMASPELVLKISKYFSRKSIISTTHLEQRALDILNQAV